MVKIHPDILIMILMVIAYFYSILFCPITLGGHWGTTDELATIPFHLVLFSAALVELEMTRECISFTLDPRDMLSLQMGLRFVRAAVACAILERISGLGPLSETTAPRYLKLVTVSSFCLFTFISLWMPLVLFVISLVFSVLISILYLVQVLSRLSTKASSYCSSSARESLSLANRRLVIFLPPMITFPLCSSRTSGMIYSGKMLKKVGVRRHPCLTPTVVLYHSPTLSFTWTA